jgi:hypothetical protein
MSGDIRIVKLNQDGLAALFRRAIQPLAAEESDQVGAIGQTTNDNSPSIGGIGQKGIPATEPLKDDPPAPQSAENTALSLNSSQNTAATSNSQIVRGKAKPDAGAAGTLTLLLTSAQRRMNVLKLRI